MQDLDITYTRWNERLHKPHKFLLYQDSVYYSYLCFSAFDGVLLCIVTVHEYLFLFLLKCFCPVFQYVVHFYWFNLCIELWYVLNMIPSWCSTRFLPTTGSSDIYWCFSFSHVTCYMALTLVAGSRMSWVPEYHMWTKDAVCMWMFDSGVCC